jgi:hypothetical protein
MATSVLGSEDYLKEQYLKDYLDWALDNLLKSNDDDELADFIEIYIGFKIPRKKVCPHHNIPFDFVADTFFERVNQAIVLANRNGGKTQNFGIKNALDALFKGCDIASVGAIQQQAEKCYGYTQSIFMRSALLNEYLIDALMKRTKVRTKDGFVSEIQILAGTKSGVNSPHPEKANLDEVELMDWEILQEAMSMPKSSKRARASLCITSTRKYSYGPMQKLLNQAEERRFKVYQWCIWEVIENCPDERSGKIIVPYTFVPYGLKDSVTVNVYNGCLDCELVEVCLTKAKQSDGYYTIEDTIDKFKNLDREVWDAQWECKKPGREGLVYREFDEDVHLVDEIPYRPGLLTLAGQDFGYTHPAATIIIQVTPSEDILLIDELYMEKTNTNILTYRYWLPMQRRYRCSEWICDPRGNDEIDQMKAANIPAKPGTDALVEAGIRTVRSFLKTHRGRSRIFISKRRCPNFIGDMGSYHYIGQNKDKFSEEGSHGPDALRYVLHTKYPSNRKTNRIKARSA